MLCDSHIHSFFSPDSSSPIEEIARTANLHHIDFFTLSDHYQVWESPDYTFDACDRANFLLGKQKLFPGLLIGVEIGEIQNNPSLLEKWLDLPFDLFLGSIHVAGDFFGPHSTPNHSDEEVYEAYFREVLKMVETTDIDAVAHIDFPRRYLSRYFVPWDIMETILKRIIERNLSLEINTSMWRKGVSWCMPDIAILQRYHALGGRRVILGSDAHQASETGMGIEKAYHLAKELDLIPGYYKNHAFIPL